MHETRHPTGRRVRFGGRVLAALALVGVIGVGQGSPSEADNVPLELRQFTVRVQEIRALDETGPFNFGLSDEIYAGFHTTVTGGQTHVQLGKFGDFDAGETRTPRTDQRCLTADHRDREQRASATCSPGSRTIPGAAP